MSIGCGRNPAVICLKLEDDDLPVARLQPGEFGLHWSLGGLDRQARRWEHYAVPFRAGDARKQARRADRISGYQGSRRQKKRIARDGLFSGCIMILALPERQTYGQETQTLEDTQTLKTRDTQETETQTHTQKDTEKRETWLKVAPSGPVPMRLSPKKMPGKLVLPMPSNLQNSLARCSGEDAVTVDGLPTA